MTNLRTALAVVSIAALGPSAALSQTPLPHVEDWGDLTGGCGPQWIGGCEVGWSAHGASNTLKIMKMTANPAAQTVVIKPGTAGAPNGVTRLFTLVPGRQLSIEVPATGLDGGATFRTRVRFINAAGAVISTQDRVKVIEPCSSNLFEYNFKAPASAVSAQVSHSAYAPTAPSARVGIIFTNGWIPFWLWPITIAPDPPPPYDPWDPPSGGEGGDDEGCESPECGPCNVSCEEGEVLISTCMSGGPPACEVIQECYCEGAGGDICENINTMGSWN